MDALTLTYYPDVGLTPSGDIVVTPTSDQVTFSTLNPISRTPTVSNVTVWEPDSKLSDAGAKMMLSMVAANGWTSVTKYKGGDCTLSNLLSCFIDAGIIYMVGHGSGTALQVASPSGLHGYYGSEAVAENWVSEADQSGLAKPGDFEADKTTTTDRFGGKLDIWFPAGTAQFFATNWQPLTTLHRAIMVLDGCSTASGPMLNSVGGRVRFGYYTDSIAALDSGPNMSVLFGNMTGTWGGGQWRTAQAAYGDGSNFIPHTIPGNFNYTQKGQFKMHGDGWTTLAPAPQFILFMPGQAQHGVFTNGAHLKGCGGIILDTYLDDSGGCYFMAYQESGSDAITAPRWMGTPLGVYGASYNFDMTDTTALNLMSATGWFVKSQGVDMLMCGNGASSGSSIFWTFSCDSVP